MHLAEYELINSICKGNLERRGDNRDKNHNCAKMLVVSEPLTYGLLWTLRRDTFSHSFNNNYLCNRYSNFQTKVFHILHVDTTPKAVCIWYANSMLLKYVVLLWF